MPLPMDNPGSEAEEVPKMREQIMKDKLGKTLEVGQVCDIFISDIVSAFVVSIEEGTLADASGRQKPSVLLLNIAIPLKLNPGQPAHVYITRESDKPADKPKETGRIH